MFTGTLGEAVAHNQAVSIPLPLVALSGSCHRRRVAGVAWEE